MEKLIFDLIKLKVIIGYNIKYSTPLFEFDDGVLFI